LKRSRTEEQSSSADAKSAIWPLVFRFLTCDELLNCQLVCRSWKDYANAKNLWFSLLMSRTFRYPRVPWAIYIQLSEEHRANKLLQQPSYPKCTQSQNEAELPPEEPDIFSTEEN